MGLVLGRFVARSASSVPSSPCLSGASRLPVLCFVPSVSASSAVMALGWVVATLPQLSVPPPSEFSARPPPLPCEARRQPSSSQLSDLRSAAVLIRPVSFIDVVFVPGQGPVIFLSCFSPFPQAGLSLVVGGGNGWVTHEVGGDFTGKIPRGLCTSACGLPYSSWF